MVQFRAIARFGTFAAVIHYFTGHTALCARPSAVGSSVGTSRHVASIGLATARRPWQHGQRVVGLRRFGFYFDPVLLYGFNEGNRYKLLHRRWLALYRRDKDVPIVVEALDVAGHYMGEPCYGVEAQLDDNGQAVVDPTHKEKVDVLYRLVQDYKEAHKINDEMRLGFHLCIGGDTESTKEKRYAPTEVPGMDDEDEDEELDYEGIP